MGAIRGFFRLPGDPSVPDEAYPGHEEEYLQKIQQDRYSDEGISKEQMKEFIVQFENIVKEVSGTLAENKEGDKHYFYAHQYGSK